MKFMRRIAMYIALAFIISIVPVQAFALESVQDISDTKAVQLLDVSQQEMLESIQHDARNGSNRAASNVSIGSNASWGSGNVNNDGQDYTGLGISYRTTANDRIGCRSCVTGEGSANGWAYVAREVNISGSGFRDANISFKGTYKGQLLAHGLSGLGSASAGVRVRVSVIDMTNGGSELDGEKVYENSSSMTIPTYGSTFSTSCHVKLRANHTYRFIVGINTSAEAIGPWDADSDFWSSDQGFGVNIDKFKVEWL